MQNRQESDAQLIERLKDGEKIEGLSQRKYGQLIKQIKAKKDSLLCKLRVKQLEDKNLKTADATQIKKITRLLEEAKRDQAEFSKLWRAIDQYEINKMNCEIQVCAKNQEKEKEVFVSQWQETKMRQYNRPSPILLHLRNRQLQLYKQGEVEQMEDAKIEAHQYEKLERQSKQERFYTAFNSALGNLKKKQDAERSKLSNDQDSQWKIYDGITHNEMQMFKQRIDDLKRILNTAKIRRPRQSTPMIRTRKALINTEPHSLDGDTKIAYKLDLIPIPPKRVSSTLRPDVNLWTFVT